jgi:hypothetical protein
MIEQITLLRPIASKTEMEVPNYQNNDRKRLSSMDNSPIRVGSPVREFSTISNFEE